jgi:hypothetical protein
MTAGLAVATALFAAGCGGGSAPDSAGGDSPRVVIQRLIALRAAQDYPALSGWIVPEHAAAVVKTLIAVDDFLAANARLRDYVRDHIGTNAALRIDQSERREHLDVFSRDVRLLDETSAGDSACVTFTVAGRAPVCRATLRRAGGIWRYDPGPGFSESLPEAFHSMARGLDQTLQALKLGKLDRAEIRRNPEPLLVEIETRLLPGAKLLGTAARPQGNAQR